MFHDAFAELLRLKKMSPMHMYQEVDGQSRTCCAFNWPGTSCNKWNDPSDHMNDWMDRFQPQLMRKSFPEWIDDAEALRRYNNGEQGNY